MPFNNKQVPISSKPSRAARNAHARAKQEFKTYDTSAIRPKKSNAPIVAGGIAAAIVVVALVIVAFVLSGCAPKVELLPDGERVVVTVSPGEGAKNIAETLLDERLIDDAQRFVDLVNRENAASSLMSGTYLFEGGMSQEEILDALVRGPASTADVLTVPEGFTRDAIANAIDDATDGRIDDAAFLKATDDASDYVADYAFLAEVGTNSLEGFLFPKTYSITAADDAVSVTRMMLDQFALETQDLDWSFAEEQGLSVYDVVKLASIVEKEAKPDNAATVAGVFYNRLASSRPYLESDATTAYEVGHDPTGEEVHADSAYSTYSNPGLPPTPICNPSLTMLEAVCDPADTDYFYFYTNPDGTYAFSVTYEEHLAAIG